MTFGDELMQVIGDDMESPDVVRLIRALSNKQSVTAFELARHVIYTEDGVELTIDNANRLVGIHLF